MAIIDKSQYKGQNSVEVLGGQLRIEEGNGRLIVRNNNYNVALFGLDDAGKVVVKVAKDGYNADTATDAQLIFNSSQNVFKIVVSATATRLVPSLTAGATDTLTIPHNLGYIPSVMAYVNGAGSTYLTAGQQYLLPKSIPVAVAYGTLPSGLINYTTIDIVNEIGYRKLVNVNCASVITAGAGTAPGSLTLSAQWNTVATPISRIDIINTGTGDFAIGSRMIILGHN